MGPDTEWRLITMVNCRTAGRKYYHLPVKSSAACLETTDGPWFMLCFMTTGIYYSLKVIGIHQKQGFGFWILIMSWASDMHCHSLWLWDSWGYENRMFFHRALCRSSMMLLGNSTHYLFSSDDLPGCNSILGRGMCMHSTLHIDSLVCWTKQCLLSYAPYNIHCVKILNFILNENMFRTGDVP